jgi:3-methyladenine DNA glycosylase AlkD/uncharacterized protein YdhG (YjbR/CyaY superfamily)
MPAPTTVAAYLKKVPAAMQPMLVALRAAIKKAAPMAEECISYQIPTYKLNGPLLHFAAFKNHCSLVVVSATILPAFANALKSFKTAGRTIQFTPANPLPVALVTQIVKMRVQENQLLPVKKKKATAKKAITTKKNITETATTQTAQQFIAALNKHQSDAERQKLQGYFKTAATDKFMGIKMGQLFAIAKQFAAMPIKEIEQLLESDIHEVRAGAISIMDKASRNKKITPERLKEFYNLYMRRHDRINNWDLVDLGCLHMTGSYLFDKPKAVLYKLATSKNQWQRRTAILSTCYFIRQGQLDDTFKIAELLIKDKEDLVHKATGWMLRFAGTKDKKRLVAFLDKYAPILPRTLLRNTLEHFDAKQRAYYMNLT